VLASAATPPEGAPLKVRRGFFTETDIGAFNTFGGDDLYSNLQVFLQLGIGYDITENIEIGLHVGIGANAANCHAGKDPRTNICEKSDNFTVTFVDLSFAYLFRVAERLYVAPKLVGGMTFLDPAPTVNSAGNDVNLAPNAGLAVGVEYATNVDHFTVGLDVVLVRYIFIANISTHQYYVKVKYTF
jgi:hypothetical protein